MRHTLVHLVERTSGIFAAKQGIGGFCLGIAHHLAEEDIQLIGLYLPDFEMGGLGDAPSERPGSAPQHARSF